MGMFAELLCIGPFKNELVEHYEYNQDYYTETKQSTPIISLLFGIDGNRKSKEFARSLGIDDPWNFNQHLIDNQSIDFAKIEEFLASCDPGQQYKRDYERLVAFVKHGYSIYFLPNG
ncbi:hypothetical protein [Parasulfitobacter algicola]|uniref:Uncharacterized protein n=1 Tax=Parasulfitobacter algicola TaxID=2614809 RepID=A0ABX2IQH2_9RHOB|nr:hypothetical protein [Sulfitobacter algicola]NSX55114.1 hypothetical protein [Sulfitobacter algicola]